MTTINETVEQSLRSAGLGNYASRATPVVQALIEREQRLYTGIVDAAASAGMNRGNVQTLLNDLGMAAPSLQPVGALYAEEQDDEEVDVDDLDERISRLEAFARANGYQG